MKNTTQTLRPNILNKYEIKGITVSFNKKEWEWQAVNRWGFGVFSDCDFKKVVQYINETY
jgi:hypothetical protein